MTPIQLDRVGTGIRSAFLWQRLVLGALLPTLPAVACFELHAGVAGLVWFSLAAVGIARQPFRAWVDERGLTFGWLWLRESYLMREVLGVERTHDRRRWAWRPRPILRLDLPHGELLIWSSASELQRLAAALGSAER